ncbi:hypothetical protein LAZ67_2006313 [Cordylochernes scorpioides]|uniref:Uncharacterized protein n=1 Tax=Cordylochernes scorpioides TaxID=51811 RepID=A0ABY6K6T5_9ARAC|nr:hypothetical protein LAZ67_2006313 [Cordylochernes scorpioides]
MSMVRGFIKIYQAWRSSTKVNGVPVCLLNTAGHSRGMYHKQSIEENPLTVCRRSHLQINGDYYKSSTPPNVKLIHGEINSKENSSMDWDRSTWTQSFIQVKMTCYSIIIKSSVLNDQGLRNRGISNGKFWNN